MYRKHRHVCISGYSNSGYVGDRGDRKSTTGYCTFVGGNLVTWREVRDTLFRVWMLGRRLFGDLERGGTCRGGTFLEFGGLGDVWRGRKVMFEGREF